MSVPLLFLSSGDLLADRRYDHARDLMHSGDKAAALDLLEQAVERAPRFASAWFLIGELREEAGDTAEAIAAFRRAREADPEDRHGAALRLARLGVEAAETAMSPAYVRTLFDQYARRFERNLLENLGYRGPDLLLEGVIAACAAIGRPRQFRRAIDLGCGTGLAGRAFADRVDALVGVDLSPAMIAEARKTRVYAELHVADMHAFLGSAPEGCCDLILAADAFVYVAELGLLADVAARALEPGGLLAFSVETHEGDGIVLGEGLRYAHSRPYVETMLADAGLGVVRLTPATTRTENGVPVPGLVAVALRP